MHFRLGLLFAAIYAPAVLLLCWLWLWIYFRFIRYSLRKYSPLVREEKLLVYQWIVYYLDTGYTQVGEGMVIQSREWEYIEFTPYVSKTYNWLHLWVGGS